MRGVPRVRVADDTLGANTVERLQIGGDLLEHGETPRAIHLANMRRDNNATIPAECDGPFHVTAHRQQWLFLWPGQIEFPGCTTTTNPERSHLGRDAPVNRVVCRSNDRPIMLQETVRDFFQSSCSFNIIRQHGLATDVAGCRDNGAANFIQQQLVQRAVGQEHADFSQPRRNIVRQRRVGFSRRQDDRPDRPRNELCLDILQCNVAAHEIQTVASLDRKHDGQRLVRTLFLLAQSSDGCRIAGIAHQVIPTDSFDGDDRASTYRGNRCTQRMVGVFNIGLAINLKSQLRSTRRAGNGFSVEAAIRRITVFAFTVSAQRKPRHARICAVVG